MDFPPPRRRETLPARLGTAQQQYTQPATVPGTTYVSPPGLSYGSNAQPVYYAPVYPAGLPSGPRPEAYYPHPAFYPQQEVHYVQAFDPRADSGEISRPRISETPRHRSPSPIVVERRSSPKSHPKRARFVDDDDSSASDSLSSDERVVIQSYHTSKSGSGYTENDGSTVYSFSPTRTSQAPSSSPTTKPEDEDVEKSEKGSASQENGTSRIRATYVFESQYTRESRLGDPHGEIVRAENYRRQAEASLQMDTYDKILNGLRRVRGN